MPPKPTAQSTRAGGRAWPWEGAGQKAFCDFVTTHGWGVTASAHTAAKPGEWTCLP